MEKSKSANRYSAEVRSRAVRMVLEHGADHAPAKLNNIDAAGTALTGKFPGSPRLSQTFSQVRNKNADSQVHEICSHDLPVNE